MKKKTLNLSLKSYIFIVIGLIIYTFGYSAFLLPCQLTGIGVSGISSVVYFGTGIPVGTTVWVLNGIFVLISVKLLGKRFAINTVVCTVIMSLLFYYWQPLFTEPLVKDTLLNTLLGSAITGIGVGITIYYGGNTAGTDIIILMIMKYKRLAYGRISMIISALIICSSWFVIPDISKLIYSFVYMFCFSYITDMVMDGFRQTYQIMIFSEKNDEIGHRISEEVGRGITIIKAAGWFTRKDRDVLLVMAHRADKH